mmetsp:Transcript_58107/g.125581  ORF Transcript_58107/g.125581 Transcript_58107/m.125581 type:complete len:380 (-) Transcript_58107:199-1338(-)
MVDAPVQVGEWTLEPGGLASCGTLSESARDEVMSGMSMADTSRDYMDRLAVADDKHLISVEEVQQYLSLVTMENDAWELVTEDSRIKVHRLRDRSLGGGVCVKLFARLPPGTSLMHAANCVLNYEDRKKWDKQIIGARLLGHAHGNDLLYGICRAAPLADRDFLAFHTLFRREDGKGIMSYQRGADNAMFPPTKAVRVTMYVLATQVYEEPDGSVCLSVMSACDPVIPLMPKWIINMLTPSEWRRFTTAVATRSKKLQAAKEIPPCAFLFEPRPPEKQKTDSTGLSTACGSGSRMSSKQGSWGSQSQSSNPGSPRADSPVREGEEKPVDFEFSEKDDKMDVAVESLQGRQGRAGEDDRAVHDFLVLEVEQRSSCRIFCC